MKKLFLVALLAGCSSGPVTPAWQENAKFSLDSFQQAYLRGETRVADVEFARAKTELQSTGRADLVARAEKAAAPAPKAAPKPSKFE